VQRDHAGCNETSLMLALYPELVDLECLGDEVLQGVSGKHPKTATAVFGEQLIVGSLRVLKSHLRVVGFLE
jgi:creatinine amidohydrolase/Fe(II)-dependent formamide hydrolase-like protein